MIAAKASFCGVLNTHFATGFTMVSAAAHERRMVSFWSQYPLRLMLSPLVEGPMMASTFSSSTSCFANDTAFSALPCESLTISCTCRPRMPPALLTSATCISSVRASGPPR